MDQHTFSGPLQTRKHFSEIQKGAQRYRNRRRRYRLAEAEAQRTLRQNVGERAGKRHARHQQALQGRAARLLRNSTNMSAHYSVHNSAQLCTLFDSDATLSTSYNG